MKKSGLITMLSAACSCGFLLTAHGAFAQTTQEFWFMSDIIRSTNYTTHDCDADQSNANSTRNLVVGKRQSNSILLTTETNNCRD